MKNTYTNEPSRSAALAGALNRPGIEILRYGLVIWQELNPAFQTCCYGQPCIPKSFLAIVCTPSLTVLSPYIEQRQGQASSNHRVGLRTRHNLKSRARQRRPTRLQVM